MHDLVTFLSITGVVYASLNGGVSTRIGRTVGQTSSLVRVRVG